MYCHVRRVLLCLAAAGIAASGVGCLTPEVGAEAPEEEQPAATSLTVNLVSEAPSGAVYRLRDAIITVTGPDSEQVFHSEDDLERMSLSANVAAGDYTAQLDAGFHLERIQGTTVTSVEAELISANPVTFTVLPQRRVAVPLRFRVDSEDVDMAQGYDIGVEVDEVGEHGLVVTNFDVATGGAAIEVFPTSAHGDVAPRRSIGGALTGIVQPRGVTVAGNEIIVVDQAGDAILVFARSASGNIPPLRRIAGFNTGLESPSGVAVFNDEIYVTHQASSTTAAISVFPLTASGNVAPARQITGLVGTEHLTIDNGEIYLAELRQIAVFDARASGAARPRRSISLLPGTTVGVLVHDGEVFVADGLNGVIRVFRSNSNGTVPPLRTISSTVPLQVIDQLAIFQGDIYVASRTIHSVHAFAATAGGTIPPLRSIHGAGTSLAGPSGVATF